jgi:hypothetical protein
MGEWWRGMREVVKGRRMMMMTMMVVKSRRFGM